ENFLLDRLKEGELVRHQVLRLKHLDNVATPRLHVLRGATDRLREAILRDVPGSLNCGVQRRRSVRGKRGPERATPHATSRKRLARENVLNFVDHAYSLRVVARPLGIAQVGHEPRPLRERGVYVS